MRRFLIIFICAAGYSVALPVAGQQVAVAPKISTLGYGADVIVGLGSYVHLRGGLHRGDVTRDLTHNEIEYEGDVELSSENLFLDLYPGGRGFRITLGAIRNDNIYEARSTENTIVEVNGVPYPVALVGRIRAVATTDEVGPYLGIGFGNAFRGSSRFRLLFDIGAYAHGEPIVDLIAEPNPGIPLPPSFEEDLAAEERSLQDEISDYEIYPVVSLSLAFRF
ncbi:MAG TPA: hypothetical protein VMS12_06910 [Thermoanaerobaculia bacterium]|nr:hypothetical protein [Thermoanaerobaculia bacterium]